MRLSSLLADLVLLGHVFIAALWWWVMPGGFPPDHWRFWANSVYPWMFIGSLLFARCFTRNGRLPMLAAISALWLVGAVSARVAFPETFRLLCVAPLLTGIAMAALCIIVARTSGADRTGVTVLFALFGIVLGTVFPITQRAPAPATHPLGSEFPTPRYDSPNDGIPIEIKLERKIGIYTRDGTVSMESRSGSLYVSPLLTFESRSPDGCWTVLAPGFGTEQSIRRRIGMNSEDGELRLAYQD